MSWTHPRITMEGFAFFLALVLALSVIVFNEDIVLVIHGLTEPSSSAVVGSNHTGPR